MKGVEGCTNRNMYEDAIKFVCESAFKAIIRNKSEYMKKWEILAEFGNPLDQYNAMHFSEMISTEEQIDYLLCFKLNESLNVRNDNLRVKLKDKNEIMIKLVVKQYRNNNNKNSQ